MAAHKVKKAAKRARSPEVTEVGRELASLALVRARQNGRLNVRQREQLRRALQSASFYLGWPAMAATTKAPMDKATKDLEKIAKKGAKAIAADLAEELKTKKAEMKELERVAGSLHKLSKTGDFEEPVEVSYLHTARNGSQGYQTKTETVTLTTAKEAQEAAEAIEKKMDSWNKLREQMLEDLKVQQKRLNEVQPGLPTFVESARGLLREVFATIL